jgi:hypothetical protein
MLAIGVDELKEPLGDTIQCPQCGGTHEVMYGEKVLPDGTKEPSKLLAFYKCGEHSYLCGIDGRAI